MPLDVEIKNAVRAYTRTAWGKTWRKQNDGRVGKKYDYARGQVSSLVSLGVNVYCPRNLDGFRFSEIT